MAKKRGRKKKAAKKAKKKAVQKKIVKKIVKKKVKKKGAKRKTVMKVPLAPLKLRLNGHALAYTLAILFALDNLLLSILAKFGYFLGAVEIVKEMTIGYSLSVIGIITGMANWAVYGLIAGFLIAWLYNKFL